MKKRQLSPFMTQELLYDYVMGHLDPERKRLVEDEIQKSPEIQEDLARIKSGISYIDQLTKTELANALLESVSRKMTYWSQMQKTFSIENWPPFVKWTLEALLVVSAVVLVSLLIPWTQVKEIVMQESRKEVILAEIPKSQTDSANEDLRTIEQTEKGNFEDEAATVAKSDVDKVESPQPTPPAKNNVAAGSATTASTAKVEESKKKGFVFRGTLSVVNVEVGSVKLKDKIVELGGRKAGEVELGWRRNQGDYYFHFTIPESKYTDLEEYFKTVGTIKISRDPHPRIMPDGIIRLIITAEEKKE